jgi:hypothetical protein
MWRVFLFALDMPNCRMATGKKDGDRQAFQPLARRQSPDFSPIEPRTGDIPHWTKPYTGIGCARNISSAYLANLLGQEVAYQI